jgi:endonuclease/exonuclease/phosphatase family metal-dependent hydrolase
MSLPIRSPLIAFGVLLLFASVTWGQDAGKVRFATFNCSLNRDRSGELVKELVSGHSKQAQKVAEILQIVRPDVILLNEVDFDAEHRALRSLQDDYLAVKQGEAEPITYPFTYIAPSNTGIDSEMDLNGDGKLHTPDDAFGFGKHPGQYGMVVLSRFPIDAAKVRQFQKFKWVDMPGALLPVNPESNEPFYDKEITSVFRLSSKSHWDVPIQIGEQTIHFLVCHPTPPVFDGREDRNGRRNHDEIRFWADYVTAGKGDYIYDDEGNKGGLDGNSLFVIAGDLNADPSDGDHFESTMDQLLKSDRIQDTHPRSDGAGEAAKMQGGANAGQQGDPACDTGDFNDRSVGNLRIDYLLPSSKLKVDNSGVFWPKSEDPLARLADTSDHHLVWVDLMVEDQP